MIIIDQELLFEFRCKRKCEKCGKKTDCGLDPHHVFSRGAGRLDIRINLIALDRQCHCLVHSGVIKKRDLIDIVSKREGLTPDELTTEIYRLRRL